MITLTGLYVYPVKSARGISLDTATLTERGIAHDRCFMLVDAAGQFLTQREVPQLARLATGLEGDVLRLSFEGLGSEQVPLVPSEGPRRQVSVWGDAVEAIELGAAVQRFLSTALGLSVALVYMPDSSVRGLAREYARDTDRVGFADGFPYLLASEASLSDLCLRAQQAIPMDRFRPNLVVRGAPAYAEDTWREIRLGAARFELVKPCTRCVVTTTCQQTGERRGPEPLASLARTRLWQGKAVFAQNAIARELGTLHVGDALQVLTPQSVT